MSETETTTETQMSEYPPPGVVAEVEALKGFALSVALRGEVTEATPPGEYYAIGAPLDLIEALHALGYEVALDLTDTSRGPCWSVRDYTAADYNLYEWAGWWPAPQRAERDRRRRSLLWLRMAWLPATDRRAAFATVQTS